MSNYQILDNIANGIHAADKIKKIYNSKLREDNSAAVIDSRMAMLNEALKIISHYSPLPNKSSLNEVITKSNLYSNTYKNLRAQIRTAKVRGIDGGQLTKTLSVISPIIGNSSHKLMIDKMIKIYEIINS